MPSFLVSATDSAPRQVFRYINATPVQIGNDISVGVNYNTASVDRQRFANLVVQFQGDLFCWVGDGIAKLQPDGLTWDYTGGVQVAGVAATAADRTFTGLHVINISGIPHLVGTRRRTGSISRLEGVFYNGQTKVWSVGGSVDLLTHEGDQAASMQRHIVYRDAIFWIGGDDDGDPTRICRWEPASDSYSLTPNPPTWDQTGFKNNNTFCVFNDRLFLLYNNTLSPLNWYLAEFVGGAWVDVDGPFGSAPNGINIVTTGQMALFTDGTNMYGITTEGPSGADLGAKCYQWDGALTRTDITTSVIPTSLRQTADGGPGTTVDANAQWSPVVDIDSSPGSPVIYLFQFNGSGAGVASTLWQWRGPASFIGNSTTPGTPVDTGGAKIHGLPRNSTSGGERLFVINELDIQITGRSSTTGGESLSFIAYGDPVVLAHGVPGIGSGFEAGETLQGGTSGAEATIVAVDAGSNILRVGGVTNGPFQSGEQITQTTGTGMGTIATLSAAPTGGSATRVVSFRFNLEGEPAVTLATLVGTVTQSVPGAGTRSGNTVVNVIADGVIEYTVTWDVTTDGLTTGTRFDLVPYVT